MEVGKVKKKRRGLFFVCLFAFHFWKRWKFILGLPKWEFSTGKKHFTPGKKSGKMTLPPQKNMPVTPLLLGQLCKALSQFNEGILEGTHVLDMPNNWSVVFKSDPDIFTLDSYSVARNRSVKLGAQSLGTEIWRMTWKFQIFMPLIPTPVAIIVACMIVLSTRCFLLSLDCKICNNTLV